MVRTLDMDVDGYRLEVENGVKEFDNDFDSLVDLIKELPPFDTLSVISDTCLLTAGFLQAGDDPLVDVNLELLQALFLIYGDDRCTKPLCVESVVRLNKLCSVVTRNHDHYRSYIADKKHIDEVNVQLTLSGMRINSQYYRNWGYVQDVTEAMLEVVSPINEYILSFTGIDLNGLLELSAYFQSPIKIEGELAELIEKYRIEKVSREEVIEYLVENINLNRESQYSYYSIDSILNGTTLSESTVVKLLSMLSCSMSSISTLNRKSLFSNNPIWGKPLIKINNQKFLLPVPNIFNSFVIDIIFKLFNQLENKPKQKAIDSFQRRRGKYVEEKTEELFREAFPRGESYRGHYLESIGTFEKDVLFKYGDVLFIIEAKSNKMTTGVRRGDFKCVEEYFEDTIVKGHKQTNDLKKLIEKGDTLRLPSATEEDLVLEPGEIKKVFRIVVMFTDLYGMQTNYRDLTGITGCIGGDLAIFSILDLKVVFEVLRCPSERLDYLIYRSEMEKSVNFKGDEMDLLGVYLTNRMRFDFDKYANSIVLADDSSSAIDLFKRKQWLEKAEATPPKVEITPYWMSLIDKLEHKLGDASRSTMDVLYSVTYDEQVHLDSRVEQCKLDVRHLVNKLAYAETHFNLSALKQGFIFIVAAQRTTNLIQLVDHYAEVMKLEYKNMAYLNIFILETDGDEPFYGYLRRSY